MPNDISNTRRNTMGDRKSNLQDKLLAPGVWKFILYVSVMVASVTVFIFASQAAQDDKIRENCSSIEQNTIRHVEHARHATEMFRKIDKTLETGQALMAETRETLIKVDVSQQQLIREMKALGQKVDKVAP